MGDEYEVYTYEPDEHSIHGYSWQQVYGGNSLKKALKAMRKHKRENNAVKLEWR